MSAYEDPRARDRADRDAGQATIHEEQIVDEQRDGFWEWGAGVKSAPGYPVGTNPRRNEA